VKATTASTTAKGKKRKEPPSLEHRRPLTSCNNIPCGTVAATGAGAKEPAKVSKEPAGYNGWSKNIILSSR